MDNDLASGEELAAMLSPFAITEEQWLDVRAWIQTTTDLSALEAFYEVLGELELQHAYACHLLENRCAELDPRPSS